MLILQKRQNSYQLFMYSAPLTACSLLESHLVSPDFKRHYNCAPVKIRLISTPFLEYVCAPFQQEAKD